MRIRKIYIHYTRLNAGTRDVLSQSPVLHRRHFCQSPLSCLYPVYVQGEVYLAAGQGSPATALEDFRPQRDRLELLDGSVSASGTGSCQCIGVENLSGGGCRCRPRPGARRLQRFLRPLERRRPRHSRPEGSQGGVREAEVACRAPSLPKKHSLPLKRRPAGDSRFSTVCERNSQKFTREG
jgi:hypothetical protein